MKKNGFTLIEIVVVVGIIGLLAALGSLAVINGIRDSYIKQAETELEMMSAAVLQLAWDTGKWPGGLPRTDQTGAEEWDLSEDECGLLATDGGYSDWKGPYFEGSTEDPWGNDYFFDADYLIDGVNHVVIGSFGPNGQGRNQYDSDDVYVLLDD